MKKPPKAPKPWKGWMLYNANGSHASRLAYEDKPEYSPGYGQFWVRIEVRPLPAKRQKAGTRGK